MEKSAILSPCRLYRYELWRRWSDAPAAAFIGLNPSTADELVDDPTIRKCIAYAQRWGYGALCMVNLFAFRATQPRDMMAAADPIGPENDKHLRSLALRSLEVGGPLVIAAWGTGGIFHDRAKQVQSFIPNLHTLKRNQDRSPSHPLYLRGDLYPFLFTP